MQPNKTRADLWMDLLLVAFLVAFNIAARLLPHAPGFLPVAASGLFAARYLRIPALAVIVPTLVPAGQVRTALSMDSVSYNLGRALAPAFGVLVLATVGSGLAFALNAASFGFFSCR